MASAMRNLTQLGPQLQALNTKLEKARVYGSSSSPHGSVNVEMTGLGIVLNISIAESLLTQEQRGQVERMTTEAMNQAIKAAKAMHIDAFQQLTGGVELFPGLNDMLKNMVQ